MYLTTDVTLGTGEQSLNDGNEGLVGLSLFLCIDLIFMRLAKGCQHLGNALFKVQMQSP